MSFARPVLASPRQIDLIPAVGQTVFGFPFPLFDPADLVVLLQVAPTGLFQPVTNGVTVTMTAAQDQGTVTFAAAPRTLATQPIVVRLQGKRVQSRISNVTRGGVVNSTSLEDELDRESIILQELRRDIDVANATASQVLALTQGLPLTPPKVSVWQWRRAIATRGEMQTVANAIGDLSSGTSAAIAWASRDTMISLNDPLVIATANAMGELNSVNSVTRFALAQTHALLPGVASDAYRTALVVAGLYATVEQTIPADPADPLNIDWFAASIVPPSGRVAQAAAAAVAFDPVALLALQNLVVVAGAANSVSTRCKMRQFRAALNVIGKLQASDQAIAALPQRQIGLGGVYGLSAVDQAAVAWGASTDVILGDPLTTLLMGVLGLSLNQMTALILYATAIVYPS